MSGSEFYMISGRREPVILVDEEGDPASFDSAEEAERSTSLTPMCQAMGHIVIEVDDNGPVGET